MSNRAPAVLINDLNLEEGKLWKIYQVKIERPPRCSTNLRPDFETFPRLIRDRSLRHEISPVPIAKRGIRTIGCHQLSPEFFPFNKICWLELYHGSVSRTNQSAIFSSIENFKIGVQEDINALTEKIQKKKNTTANYKFFTSHLPKQLAKVWKRSKNNFHIKLSVIYRVSQKKVLIEKKF